MHSSAQLTVGALAPIIRFVVVVAVASTLVVPPHIPARASSMMMMVTPRSSTANREMVKQHLFTTTSTTTTSQICTFTDEAISGCKAIGWRTLPFFRAVSWLVGLVK